ncbi:MAG: YdcF family protein [Patescibacteria group bacterium]
MSRPFDSITDFIFVENQPVKADIILVLGGYRPQLIEKAVELFKRGFAQYILPSGGIGPKLAEEIEAGRAHWKSEWEFLQNIALKKGVPEKAVLKEDKALNTFDNARLSFQVLREMNIEVKKAILICKAHHARRALLTYQTAFSSKVEYIVCPTIDDRNIRKDNWFLDKTKITLVMSEVEKIGQYFAKHITYLNNG